MPLSSTAPSAISTYKSVFFDVDVVIADALLRGIDPAFQVVRLRSCSPALQTKLVLDTIWKGRPSDSVKSGKRPQGGVSAVPNQIAGIYI